MVNFTSICTHFTYQDMRNYGKICLVRVLVVNVKKPSKINEKQRKTRLYQDMIEKVKVLFICHGSKLRLGKSLGKSRVVGV